MALSQTSSLPSTHRPPNQSSNRTTPTTGVKGGIGAVRFLPMPSARAGAKGDEPTTNPGTKRRTKPCSGHPNRRLRVPPPTARLSSRPAPAGMAPSILHPSSLNQSMGANRTFTLSSLSGTSPTNPLLPLLTNIHSRSSLVTLYAGHFAAISPLTSDLFLLCDPNDSGEPSPAPCETPRAAQSPGSGRFRTTSPAPASPST
eukprot:CAMPEP_0173459768 /NCGR_PEP_ID=MMETSP1357-20121228/62007_1 /TAXON_ID=77926 /ORGANISM="Hemiselmis rufescens, Strain PCC563" /LENGTH=200 /DNA_ID=CAMNT_0014427263 /DNA_START=92 /DNA_END=692 /DNA_ORIENTATION=+